MLGRIVVSHIPLNNPKPIIIIPPMHVTTELITSMKSSGAGQFYIDLVDGSYKRHRERIAGVVSVQATTKGTMKSFGPRWWIIPHIALVRILSHVSMKPEIHLSKRLSALPSRVAEMGRPNLIMLRTVISQIAKAFAGKTDQIPPPGKVRGMTYDEIETVLRFRVRKLAWLKHYLWSTFTTTENIEKVIMCEY